MGEVEPLRASGGRVEALDQTLLPQEERYVTLDSVEAFCEAIRSLRVRGAPLLGLCGAFGMAVAAGRAPDDRSLDGAARLLTETRPTAADLGKAVQASLAALLPVIERERETVAWSIAEAMLAARGREDRAIGTAGAALLPEEAAVLTHCNTGALATGGIGTALGVIRAAWEQGRLRECYATETRPLLQGARLTTWELGKLGIPHTLLPDAAASALLGSGRVHAVITGADRIAANGDTANKVGTCGLALAASAHGVPFYVAAPTTTVDLGCESGGDIPIEFRNDAEVRGFRDVVWAPEGTAAFNPAFDVTPAALIAAIVTERGVVRPPFTAGLERVMTGGNG